MDKYVCNKNFRIIGYTSIQNKDVIIISNIDDRFQFISNYKSLLGISRKKKIFNYLEYPSDQYVYYDEDENTLNWTSMSMYGSF